MTVDQAVGADHGEVPPWEDPKHLRVGAVLVIARGITAADLRGWAEEPGNPNAADDLALADEVESLTAHGLTKRHAGRARSYSLLGDDSVRLLAKLRLASGVTPRQVRKDEARKQPPNTARFLARIADAMDALLAEGFDPAAGFDAVTEFGQVP